MVNAWSGETSINVGVVWSGETSVNVDVVWSGEADINVGVRARVEASGDVLTVVLADIGVDILADGDANVLGSTMPAALLERSLPFC